MPKIFKFSNCSNKLKNLKKKEEKKIKKTKIIALTNQTLTIQSKSFKNKK